MLTQIKSFLNPHTHSCVILKQSGVCVCVCLQIKDVTYVGDILWPKLQHSCLLSLPPSCICFHFLQWRPSSVFVFLPSCPSGFTSWIHFLYLKPYNLHLKLKLLNVLMQVNVEIFKFKTKIFKISGPYRARQMFSGDKYWFIWP